MPIDRPRLLLMIGSACALSACAEPHGGVPYMGGPTNFGEANRQTMAAQVVNPLPVYDTPLPETSGEHAEQAITRYRTDKVKRPANAKISNVATVAASAAGN
ncbi:hypothetical protein K3M67_16195 (plasmid) [Sphingobium sp. V4]|uniref:hypothetical protein n=1 Tax=Sphingobium sp. V4 TaxID=3038927 RepID=UPI002557EEA5|nr:hypothetical protein [Sphingobium sp. V4]WIW90619.1 hypothetical protein K3M67_16195 [Sphingobium sp. V4]